MNWKPFRKLLNKRKMLKIKRKGLLSQLNIQNSNEPNVDKKSNILKWVEEEMESFSFNLSD